ncbi:hypothetical protein BV25DRAFT_1858796 [Artomyces pyxidatus]|uniref:Uncharacterized protein n=1 Tax=Artomyces pyxidatus TaxID=48021 RepID=A0ACB8SX96_9AGAM|nr:hypothetical protein BV25DRAFT_1858796 [Artomyces pyxidatus]
MSGTCQPEHDWFSDLLSGGLLVGLCISYAPQLSRIVNKGSSEGFSPWFLLLGSTSAASGMLNIIIMQWSVIRCCRVFSTLNCLEAVAGVLQVVLTWFLFTSILVLYMIYYPQHLKYATVPVDTYDSRPSEYVKTNIKSHDWQLSITLSWVVFIHITLVTFVTFLLISSSPNPSSGVRSPELSLWATFLGVSSGGLAALQYLPQLVHTYRMKLVGALSIPMMFIQTPGGLIMVLSIALKPGTNWTTWIQFLVAAIMQAILLAMCLSWKVRQRKLHIDDFGHPLPSSNPSSPQITRGPDEDVPVEEAVEVAVEEDLVVDGERAPLLAGKKDSAQKGILAKWGWTK